MKDVEEKLVKMREESAFYTEHETGEGKKYYFNTKTSQSTWDKPKCISEVTELEAKLEELKKRRIERSAAEMQKSGQQQKKEKDKENELSEEEKAKQKSKPVSSTAVPGTPWCVVWTRDKRVFFYNPSEKVSLWERPPILIGRSDVDKMIKECPVSLQDGSAAANNTTSTAAATTAQKKKTPVEANPVAANSEPPVKKNK